MQLVALQESKRAGDMFTRCTNEGLGLWGKDERGKGTLLCCYNRAKKWIESLEVGTLGLEVSRYGSHFLQYNCTSGRLFFINTIMSWWNFS